MLILNELVQKLLIGIIVLIFPWIIGYILNFFNIQPIGFLLFAIYGQIFLLPYSAYLDNFVIFLSSAHWLIMILLISFIFEKKSIKNYIFFSMLAIIIVTVITHITMRLLGLRLFIDSI